MLNLNAAQELLKLYKTITLNQIKVEYKQLLNTKNHDIAGHDVLEVITGFGSNEKCKLCTEARQIAKSNDPRIFCQHCVYNDGYYDDFYCIDTTYTAICNAENPDDIYQALQDRIIYLEKIIKKLTENEKNNNI